MKFIISWRRQMESSKDYNKPVTLRAMFVSGCNKQPSDISQTEDNKIVSPVHILVSSFQRVTQGSCLFCGISSSFWTSQFLALWTEKRVEDLGDFREQGWQGRHHFSYLSLAKTGHRTPSLHKSLERKRKEGALTQCRLYSLITNGD